MATAELIEIDPVEQRARDIADYEQPLVRIGDLVNWYPDADRGAGRHLCHVAAVGAKSIKLVCLSNELWGMVKDSVRHCSDPDLKYRPMVRHDEGGWDYLPQESQLRAEQQDLELRLGRLEEVVYGSRQLPTDLRESSDASEATTARTKLTGGALHNRIKKMADEGKAVGDIAADVGQSHDKVREILAKHGKQALAVGGTA